MPIKLLQIDQTVRDALVLLNEAEISLVVVIDNNRVTFGTITDGDIRRFLLINRSLDEPCTLAMNRDFKFIIDGEPLTRAREICLSEKISEVIIVDSRNVFLSSYKLESHTPFICGGTMPVVIMAGGKGSRLLPLTEDIPKPMIDVAGEPMLLRQIKRLHANGLTTIYLSVNYLKDQIIDYFGDGSSFGVQITYLEEDQPLGTAGSLSLIDSPVKYNQYLILNADILHEIDLQALINYHIEEGALATVAANTVKTHMQFGVLNVLERKLISIDEKPIFTHLVNAGIYILGSSLLSSMEYNKYLDMTTLLDYAKNQSSGVSVFPIHEDWIDVGLHSSLEIARKKYSQ